jgi:hypothetical protein
MADWSLPTLTSTYTNFLSQLQTRDTDLALQFDGTTTTNQPVGTIRWDSTANRWKKWTGSAWGELAATYALTALSTTGNANIGGTLGVTGQTTLATATATTPATADNNTNIATTAFVKAQGYALLASPTFTGTPAAPTAAVNTNTTQIATTAFVNAEIANDALLKTGGTMTGAITLSGDPTVDLHAVPRQWVEARASKESCRVATTAALTVTATASTLTNAGTLAAISIDGIALSVGDRVLVKDQTTTNQNGIYTVTTVGSASVAWVMTRATDADTWTDLVGAYSTVEQGTVNDNTFWISEIARGGTLGTTAITWQLGANPQTAAFGNLALTGLVTRTAANTITARSLAVSGTGLTVTNADGVSGNPTVTSNATSGNVGSAIVSRDASGNFSAGTITATLSGNATTATSCTGNAANVTGTVAIANGGTGQTTAANAINALVPSQTGNSGKILTTNGSVVSWGAASVGGDVQTFNSSGTWTKPASGTWAIIRCWGGGGSGGRNSYAGGGGGGGCFERMMLLSDLTATVTVTIGAGGTGVSVNGPGNAGGDTTFGAYVTGKGGGPGLSASGGVQAGGSGGGGTGILFAGGAGSNNGQYDGAYGGGSGGPGSSITSCIGGNSSWGGGGGGGRGNSATVYAGGSSQWGGAGSASNGSTAGSTPGGGSGGVSGITSGNGGGGQCTVWVI